MSMELQFESPLWRYQGESAWHFVTLPDAVGQQIKFFSGPRQGFGSVRVVVSIGSSRWTTSAFPDKKSGSYLLPIKAEVRKHHNLKPGEMIKVRLQLDL
jgi:hypothetical protein